MARGSSTVRGNDAQRRARGAGRELHRRGSVRLTPVDPADDDDPVRSRDGGQGYFWSHPGRPPGAGEPPNFWTRERGITVVNVLDIESYLLAVVPSEMYPTMELEALKAQAIAARTYTLPFRGRYSLPGV